MNYIAIKDEDLKMTKELLETNNIKINGIWNDPFEIFAEREADYRITCYEHEENVVIPDDKKDIIRLELYNRYSNSEDLLDAERLSDIQSTTIEKYL